jgi:hypothetical protein
MAPRRTGSLETGIVDNGTSNILQPIMSPLLNLVREMWLSDTWRMQREESSIMVGTGVKMKIFSKGASGVARLFVS